MVTPKYVSCLEVINRFYKEVQPQFPINEIDLVGWIADAMDYLRVKVLYKQAGTELEVTNHIAELPCDFYKIDILNDWHGVPMQYSGNDFNWDFHTNNSPNLRCTSGNTYRFSDDGQFINTNMPNGKIKLVYLAVPSDDKGYPLVPDDISFKRACVAYTYWQWATPQWRRGEIRDGIYEEAKSEWFRLCGQAKGEALMPDVPKMEQIRRVWTRMVQASNAYQHNFSDLDTPDNVNFLRPYERLIK